MSLFKQIALIVTMGVLVLLVLVSMDNFQRTSQFLEGQMQSSAQDVATTLGIAITTTGTAADKAALETYFNAMFDSGYYSQIQLLDMQESVVHIKARKLAVDGIPDWFIDLVPLKPAIGKAHVRLGWVTAGTLEVTVHPALAYAELYKNMKASVAWFGLLFLLILGVLWFDLHILLRPLGRIREQAQAIHENTFIKQETLPKTLELRSVVSAMNHMITKVQTIFHEQEQTLARCQNLIYTDEFTGLANRKFLLSYLDEMTDDESSFNGHMVVIKLQNFAVLRDQQGYQKADICLETLVSIFNERTAANGDEFFARMSEDEFSFCAPYAKPALDEAIRAIFETFKRRLPSYIEGVHLMAAAVPIQGGSVTGTILAELDMALSQVLVRGAYAFKYAETTPLLLPQGKIEWRLWFKDKLEKNGFYMVAQPVLDREQQITQRELFIRVNDQHGHVIPAGIFMPMAQVLGYDVEIDRKVFQLVNSLAAEQDISSTYALNLSASFFQRADALDAFSDLLAQFEQRKQILYVEASHQAYCKAPDMFKQIANTVKEHGHAFGIDHLDLTISSETLQMIQPNYVKISARLLEDLSQTEASGAYQALYTLTSALEIELIAVGVESTELAEKLLALGVDGLQGNALAEPEVLS